MRIGILGASQAAVESVIEPAKRLGHQVVVVGSSDRERGQEFAAAHSIPEAVKGYLRVLDRGDLDLCYVGLVNAAHAYWAGVALEHGRHVLVEKPLTVDLAQANTLLTGARAQQRHVFDGYHYAHHPMFARVLAIATSGEIGDVLSMDTRLAIVRPAPTSSRWSFELGGGSLLDLGCYGLDACARLAEALGGSAEVTAALARPSSMDPRVDARMSVELLVAGAVRARVRCRIDSPVWSMAAHDVWKRLRSSEAHTRGMIMSLRIVGRSGTISAGNFVVPQLDDRLLVRSVHGARTERLGRIRSYDWQMRHIAELVGADQLGTGTPHLTLGRHDPLRTSALIDAARRAADLAVTGPDYQPALNPSSRRANIDRGTPSDDCTDTVIGNRSHGEP